MTFKKRSNEPSLKVLSVFCFVLFLKKKKRQKQPLLTSWAGQASCQSCQEVPICRQIPWEGCLVAQSGRISTCTPSSLTGSLTSCGPTGETPAGWAGVSGPSCQMAPSWEALCSKELRSLRRVVVSSTTGSSDFSVKFSEQVAQPSKVS